MESASDLNSLVTVGDVFVEEVSGCGDRILENSDTHGETDYNTKPCVGMEFDSLHQAFLFYNEYAAIVGFSVRKDKTRKSNVDGSYLFRRFCCSKEGYPRNSRGEKADEGGFVQMRDGVAVKVELIVPPVPRLSRRAKIEMKKRAEVLQKMRVGCNAKLDVKRGSNGKWVVQKFVEEHNHECVSLGDTHLLRSHRGRLIATNGQDGGGHEGGGELASSDDRSQYIELNCVQPSIGMEFESHHKAFLFYNAYARVLGFIVRKDKTRKSNIDGSLLFRRFCCSREGYRRKNDENDNNAKKQVRGGTIMKVRPRVLPVTRVGCNAKMEVKKTSDGKWVVQKFIEEHNHEFDRLGDMNLLRSQKPIELAQGQLIDAVTGEIKAKEKLLPSIEREDFRIPKLLSGKPRFRHRMSKKRKRKFEKGELQVMFNYFKQMQTENPSFFYAVQLDEDDQVLSCFWADARSRLDFGYFGDVICFETNYGTCQYGRPFAPIFGVNHHSQTLLFGCAIILNENEESFTWLLETLLRAMRGHRPIRIISDQNEEMQNAIDRVLPGTHHCLSLQYIFQSTATNLSHLYNTEVDFSTDFKKCIYEPQISNEFETRWALLLGQYQLRDNEWLDNIYSKRHKWVPLYTKHVFHADMMTSQRSDSIHSFFNDYMNRACPFDDFFSQYEKALADSREKEAYEDLKSHQVRHVLKSDLPMEKQAADTYTRSMFKEFHKEFCDSFSYIAEETDVVETNRRFVVSRWGQSNSCVVNFYSCENGIRASCSCLNFELMGILCRHILKVFTATNVMLVPDVYVKKRWTKRAKWGIISDDSNKEMQTDHGKSVALHYSVLCQLALNISAKGALSLKAFQIAKSNIVIRLREMEKKDGEVIHTTMTQPDIDDIRIPRSSVEVIGNTVGSKNLISEDNHILPRGQVVFYDHPHRQARDGPLKRITTSVGERQSCKKSRTGPDTSDDVLSSHSRSGVPEPNEPCHVGVGGQETQNHRLLNMLPNVCLYACPPAPPGDLNDQYHSSENAGFGEPFAGLPCIQASEPNIFDLNQDVTVGPSSLRRSQTSHLDLNEVNHVARSSNIWSLPSSGWLKLNFGGNSKEVCLGSTTRRVAGYGGTISVSDGSVIKAYAGPGGEVETVDSEILGLWNGLKVISTLPSSPVWIEGDSQLVIKWLRRDSDIPWRFTPMFFEIESIMSRLIIGKITNVHREENAMADKLANEGLSKDSLTIWDQLPNL